MKYLFSLLTSVFLISSFGFAAYSPTAIDAQLISTFSANITQMYTNNPSKVAAIAPKLQIIVNSFDEDTREHYVLEALYMHITSLMMPTTMIADTVTVTVSSPTVVTPTTTATNTTTVTTNTTTTSPSIPSTASTVSDPLWARLVDFVNSHYTKWNPDAQFSLIEFTDFQCPFCQQYHINGTLDSVLQHYGNSVNVAVAYFPLTTHPLAAQASNAVECVAAQWGSSAFYAMKNELFRAGNFFLQPTRSNLMKAFDTLNSGSWDKSAYEACVDNNTYGAKVSSSKQLGIDIWVTGTPTNVFLNKSTGQYKVIQWAIGVDAWIDIIAELEPTL